MLSITVFKKNKTRVSMPSILKTSKVFGVPNASVWAQGTLCNMLLQPSLYAWVVSSVHLAQLTH